MSPDIYDDLAKSYLDKQSKPQTSDRQPNPYDNFIEDSAARYDLDSDLIRAMMKTESANKPKATSYKGASGLMQLMPATAQRFGVTDIYDPKQNIEGGAKYMRWLLDKFNGNVDLALAGYNAGEGAVIKYGNQIPPFTETQNYVKQIRGNYTGSGRRVAKTQTANPYESLAQNYLQQTPNIQQNTNPYEALAEKTLSQNEAVSQDDVSQMMNEGSGNVAQTDNTALITQKQTQLLNAKTPKEKEAIALEINQLQNGKQPTTAQNNGDIQIKPLGTPTTVTNPNQAMPLQTDPFKDTAQTQTLGGQTQQPQKLVFKDSTGEWVESDNQANVAAGYKRLTNKDTGRSVVLKPSADGKKVEDYKEEFPDWLTGKTKGATPLGARQKEYDAFLSTNDLGDTEERRQKFLKEGYTAKDLEYLGIYKGEAEKQNKQVRRQKAQKIERNLPTVTQTQNSQTVQTVSKPDFTTSGKLVVPMNDKDGVQTFDKPVTLSYDKTNQDDLEEGEYRLIGEDGEPYIFAGGRIVAENANDVVETLNVSLAKKDSVTVDVARRNQATQVADAISEKYGLKREDVIDFWDNYGFRNLKTGENNKDEDYFTDGKDKKFYEGNFENRLGDEQNAGTTPVQITERDINLIREFSNRRATLSPQIEAVANDYLQKGDKMPYIAAVKAQRDLGLMPTDKADKEIAAYEELYKQNYDYFKNTYTPLRRDTDEFRSDADIAEMANTATIKELGKNLNQSGSFAAKVEENRRIEALPFWTRKVPEMGKEILRTIPAAYEAVLKTFGGLSAANPLSLENLYNAARTGGSLTNRIKTEDSYLYQGGKSFEYMKNEMIPSDPLARKSYWVTATGGLSQGILWATLAYASGGTVIPTVMGLSQGYAEQQDNAIKEGATQNEQLARGLIGATLAVPDILLQNKFFKSLTKVEQTGFVRQLFANVYNGLKEKVGEKLAASTTEKGVAAFLGRLAKNGIDLGKNIGDFFDVQNPLGKIAVGTLFEAGQETSEGKGNKLAAKLINNPKITFGDILSIDEDFKHDAVGGAAGGLFGGSFEVSSEAYQKRQRIFNGILENATKDSFTLGGQNFDLTDTIKPVISEYRTLNKELNVLEQKINKNIKAAKTLGASEGNITKKADLVEEAVSLKNEIKIKLERRNELEKEILDSTGFKETEKTADVMLWNGEEVKVTDSTPKEFEGEQFVTVEKDGKEIQVATSELTPKTQETATETKLETAKPTAELTDGAKVSITNVGEGVIVKREKNGQYLVDFNPRVKSNGEIVYQSRKTVRAKDLSLVNVSEVDSNQTQEIKVSPLAKQKTDGKTVNEFFVDENNQIRAKDELPVKNEKLQESPAQVVEKTLVSDKDVQGADVQKTSDMYKPTDTVTTNKEVTATADVQKTAKTGKTVKVGDRSVTLDSDQAERWQKEVEEPLAQAKADFDADIKRAERAENSRGATNSEIRETANKRFKAASMQISAVKREITGLLTANEQKVKDQKEKSNYIGKEVSVGNKNATVVGNPFGKVKVRFADGTEQTVASNQIRPTVKTTSEQSFTKTDKDTSATTETKSDTAKADRSAKIQDKSGFESVKQKAKSRFKGKSATASTGEVASENKTLLHRSAKSGENAGLQAQKSDVEQRLEKLWNQAEAESQTPFTDNEQQLIKNASKETTKAKFRKELTESKQDAEKRIAEIEGQPSASRRSGVWKTLKRKVRVIDEVLARYEAKQQKVETRKSERETKQQTANEIADRAIQSLNEVADSVPQFDDTARKNLTKEIADTLSYDATRFETASDKQLASMATRALSAEDRKGVKLKSTSKQTSLKADNQKQPLKMVSRNERKADFYSQLERTIEAKMPNRASAEQVRAILTNPNNQVKKEEFEWLDLDSFLQTKDTFTKAEILDFVRANNVQIEEVVKENPQTPLDSFNRKIETAQAILEDLDDEIDSFGKGNESADTLQQKTREVRAEIRQGNADKLSLWIGKDKASEFLVRYKQAQKRLEDAENEKRAYRPSEVKFARYQLEGEKENYRELLLTMPLPKTTLPKDAQVYFDKEHKQYFVKSSEGIYNGDISRRGGSTEEEAKQIALNEINRERSGGNGQIYTSSHFTEPNILAHIRFNERTDADGNRTLFVEEIQSDWGQDGRKKGYKSDKQRAEVVAEFRKLGITNLDNETISSLQNKGVNDALITKFETQYLDTVNNVPDMPFKKSWHELAFKKILRVAAENGFDSISWTTGEQQADRYDLSKQINEINAQPNKDGTYDLSLYDKEDNLLFGRDERFTNVKPEKLDDLVGKDLAQKIINNEGDNVAVDKKHPIYSYKGDDLKVGGEGMKGFYDKILPSFANKFGKKFGAKVETAEIAVKSRFKVEAESGGFTAFAKDKPTDLWTPEKYFETKKEADKWVADSIKEYGDWDGNRQQVHSLPITPQMRELVQQGLPLFKLRDGKTADNQKALAQAEYLDDIIPNAETSRKSDKNGNNIVELNEEAAEVIRTVLADINGQNRNDAPLLAGLLLSPATVKPHEVTDALLAYADEAESAGIDVAALDKLTDAIIDAEKDNGTVRLVVFDDALAHETVHQQSELGVTDSERKNLTSRRDIKGLRVLANDKSADGKTFRKMFDKWAKAENYDWKPETAKDWQLGHAAEEIFTYIADGDTLGADVESAAKIAVRLNLLYAQARQKEARSAGKPRPTIREALKTFDNTSASRYIDDTGESNEGNARNNTNTTESGGSRTVQEDVGRQNDSGNGRDNQTTDSRKTERETGTAKTPKISDKLSNTPKTLRDAGVPLDDRFYTGTTNVEQQSFANAKLDKGIDEADKWLKDAVADGDYHNGATTAVALSLMNHYGKTGQIAELNQIADKIVPMLTEAGQAIQAMALVSVYNPDTAGTYAAKVKKQKTGKDITPAEHQKAVDLATALSETAKADGISKALLEKANEAVKELETENQTLLEVNKILDGRASKLELNLTDAAKKIRNLKAKVKRLEESKPKTSRKSNPSVYYRKLIAKQSDIKKRLSESFGDSLALKMVASKDEYVYHGTGEGAFRSIREHGLKPKVEHNYFADTEQYAESYASRKGSPFGHRVLRVRKTAKLQHDKNTGLKGDYKTTEFIPPSDIEVKINGKWIPIQEYADEDINIMPIVNSPLKMVSPSTRELSADETQDLTDFAALEIVNHSSYEDTISKLEEITKGEVSDEDIQQIHAAAVQSLEGAPMSETQKEHAKLRAEHRKQAKTFVNRYDTEATKLIGELAKKLQKEAKEGEKEGKQVAKDYEKQQRADDKANKPLDKFTDLVIQLGIRNGYTDEAVFASLARQTFSPDEVIKQIQTQFPDLTRSQVRQALKDSDAIYTKAKDEVRRYRTMVSEQRSIGNKTIERIQDERRANSITKTRATNQANAFYAGLSKSTPLVLAETAVNYRKANLLSAVKTHLKNMVGNTAFAASEEGERIIASIADAIVSNRTHQRSIQGMSLKGVAQGFKSVFKQDETLKNIDADSGLTMAKNIMLYGDTVDNMTKQQLSESHLKEKFNWLKSGTIADAYINFVFRTLSAEDALFKAYAFRRSLEEQAHVIAKNEHSTDASVDVKSRRKELITNPTNVMQLTAQEYADFATFQNDNWFTSNVTNKLKSSNPYIKTGIELLVPFDKTPTNIINRVLDHTPVGAGKAVYELYKLKTKPDSATKKINVEYRGAVEKDLQSLADWDSFSADKKRKLIEKGLNRVFDQKTQREFARLVGSSVAGTAALIPLGFILASMGLMAGAFSPDDDDRDETNIFFDRMKEGVEPGSILIPGLGRFRLPDSPFAKAMLFGATMYEQGELARLQDKDAVGAVMEGMSEASKDIIFEQPLMRQTKDLLDSRQSVGGFTGNLASGFIPASSMVRSISEITDDDARKKSGYTNKEAKGRTTADIQGTAFKRQFFGGIPFLREKTNPVSTTTVSPQERGGWLRRLAREFDFTNFRSNKNETDVEIKKSKAKK